MSKRNLNFKFINPNSADETACVLLDFLVGVNMQKAEEAVKNAASEKESEEGHPV